MKKKKKECIILGLAIKRLRHQKEISQEQLADLAGLHRTYMGGLERGEKNPTLTTILKVCNAFDITPIDFFTCISEVK